MPRLRQVPRAELDDPVSLAMYDLVFGEGVDPLESGTGTATGSEGNWWTVYANVPDVLEHAVQGFVLYRSPARALDPVLRELALTRTGWLGGSTFVYSQHCKALRGLGVDSGRIAALDAWATATVFDERERAVLAYADAVVQDRGRVADAVFAELQAHLSDAEILELTYVVALYGMHATVVRALRLEFDDRPEPVHEVDPPEGFDAGRFATTGATDDARAQLASIRADDAG
jgi:alkylhydroperoxidase family enzyme